MNYKQRITNIIHIFGPRLTAKNEMLTDKWTACLFSKSVKNAAAQ
jgi:hypothetical protein